MIQPAMIDESILLFLYNDCAHAQQDDEPQILNGGVGEGKSCTYNVCSSM